jgi:hypothetical protein
VRIRALRATRPSRALVSSSGESTIEVGWGLGRVPPSVLAMRFALVRQGLFMDLRAVEPAGIQSIVNDLFPPPTPVPRWAGLPIAGAPSESHLRQAALLGEP